MKKTTITNTQNSNTTHNSNTTRNIAPKMKEYLKPIIFNGADCFLQAHIWLLQHPRAEVWSVDCHEWDDAPGITLHYVAAMPADEYDALQRMKENQVAMAKQAAMAEQSDEETVVEQSDEHDT